ncbi:MAG: hypothetical protein AAF633_15210 [Chloroflexota bacterium]
MARKRDLANKLSNEPAAEPATRPGWRDTIGPPPAQLPQRDAEGRSTRGNSRSVSGRQVSAREPEVEVETEDPQKLKRKTYLLTQELIERIALLADQERVGINELVRFLLTEAVISVENGDLEIPTGPAKRQILQ